MLTENLESENLELISLLENFLLRLEDGDTHYNWSELNRLGISFASLETLSDPVILKKANVTRLNKKNRNDAILYIKAWIDLLYEAQDVF